MPEHQYHFILGVVGLGVLILYPRMNGAARPNNPIGEVNQAYRSHDPENGDTLQYSPQPRRLSLNEFSVPVVPGLARFLHQPSEERVKFGSNGSIRPAVVVQSGKKAYGKYEVLQGLNMTVPEGTIYGLVGSSGCGKTTLLSCIVGLRQLDAGNIYICGEVPGTPESGVPGKRVGYMPQEIALNGEFTVKEVCHYFGRIYGMDKFQIADRIHYLVDLLDLKRCRGQLKDMSGGQQRRVSFAVALLHEPEMLILDEPTVGVDPVLRANIWKHLRELVDNNGITVIITTHYIEEMRQADTVAIMRKGLLMAESSPTRLLELHNASMLEDVVLKYCLKDTDAPKKSKYDKRKSCPAISTVDQFAVKETSPVPLSVISYNDWKHGPTARSSDLEEIQTKSWDRLRALVYKNVLVMLRNVAFLLFTFMCPSLIIAIFCYAIGSDPVDLKVGVINRDVTPGFICGPAASTCKAGDNLSCRFLDIFDGESIKLISIKDEAEALKKVEEKKLWGYIEFPHGFSENTLAPLIGKALTNPNASQIQIKLDMSSISIGLTIKKLVFDAFRGFSQNLLTSCGIESTGRELPIVFVDPYYGSYEDPATNFIAPGVAVGFLFFMGALTCGLAYIIEKKDGMLNRTIVAGVNTLEIMMSHLITQFGIGLVQTVLAFVIMFIVFDIPREGSPFLAFILTILCSIAGMSLGFLGATVCDEEKNAMLMAIGMVMPNFLLSGQIWALEGLPPAFYYISYLLPGTLATEAMRSILLRGWGMSYYTVWIGFVSIFGWITFYWLAIVIIHKIRTRKH